MPRVRKVSVVVPVYGDWPSLSECIESLKAYLNTDIHRVLLVNDCGPEADMIERNIKRAIKGVAGFKYYRNPENLGFIGNCNRAVLELDETDNDILLLNSDTKVTKGFLDEMLAVLYAEKMIAAVSPRSNNATLATVPLRTAPQKGIEPIAAYAIYERIRGKLPVYNEIPVAHGFCMLIRRTVIKKYGLFDTVFGKGYGEEVDFCMRIKQHGYKCALSNRAFVFHLEARSFTIETKNKLLESNNKIIWERYPDYRQSVRDYMETAIAKETKLEGGASLKTKLRTSTKQALKRASPRVYRLAQKVRAHRNKT